MTVPPLLSRLAGLALLLPPLLAQPATVTESQYLSGHGPADAVAWEFFCTDGRQSREWTTIPVPSCWETEGFGAYNYGGETFQPYRPIGTEQGLYRHRFTVPADWAGRAVRLVFDGVMTDASVWLNGESVGPTHNGAFYSFSYDVSPLLHYGEGETNLLQVTVSKVSGDPTVNRAERAADYWVFGGIFRPVWLEARPPAHIEWTALDARADGELLARVHRGGDTTFAGSLTAVVRDAAGTELARFAQPFAAGDPTVDLTGRVKHAAPWTAETPVLHTLELSLADATGAVRHTTSERFGFRTIEVRPEDGIYVNGTKVRLKGVNRHSFWPETGRTVSREQSFNDVRLMKAANLNAVRMSHYPPDRHFLEACDELGLYVFDELGGWQASYSTVVGRRLIRELVQRDVNHPSILFWDNGNEGGWNTENDDQFARWDPQQRPVIHPWGVHSDINTDHYENYASHRHLAAGPQIYLPTEVLHGLYDGGSGTGLRDYWDAVLTSPTAAGMVLWAWCDEGVVRTDQDGRIDNVGNAAPDGIVGPHREPEGSYYTIKRIWSPVQLPAAASDPAAWGDDTLAIDNTYDFTDLAQVDFRWELVRLPGFADPTGPRTVLASWQPASPAVAPHQRGQLAQPLRRPDFAAWADTPDLALQLTATDAAGRELNRWSWLSAAPALTASPTAATPAWRIEDSDTHLDIAPADGGWRLRFDRRTGRLATWTRDGATAPIADGPRFVASTREGREFQPIADPGTLTGFAWHEAAGSVTVDATYDGDLQTVHWEIAPDGTATIDARLAFAGTVELLGLEFDLDESALRAKRWVGRGPYRVYRNRLEGGVPDLWQQDFNDPIPGRSFTYPEFKGYFADWRWLELSTRDGGILRLGNASAVPYLGLGAMRDGDPKMLTFPATGLALLDVIPAQATKFILPEDLGPAGQPVPVDGDRHVRFVLSFTTSVAP